MSEPTGNLPSSVSEPTEGTPEHLLNTSPPEYQHGRREQATPPSLSSVDTVATTALSMIAANEKEVYDLKMKEIHQLKPPVTGVQTESELAKGVSTTESNPTTIDNVVETAAEVRGTSEKAVTVTEIQPKGDSITTGAVAPQLGILTQAPQSKGNEPTDVTTTSSKPSSP